MANLGEDVYGNGAKIADQTAGGGIAGTDTCNGVKGSVTSSVPCWSGGAYSRSYIVNDAGLYTCGVNETKTCTDIYLLQISSWCTNNDDGTSNNAPFYHVYSRTVECKKAAALVKYY